MSELADYKEGFAIHVVYVEDAYYMLTRRRRIKPGACTIPSIPPPWKQFGLEGLQGDFLSFYVTGHYLVPYMVNLRAV